MARAVVRLAGGGGGLKNVVEHPYYLKPMPGNPFIGTEHDGRATEYMTGFTSKPMNWLYRFRHNSQPIGIPTGFYNRNPQGKYVHWLEVSTIEKMRVQLVGEEAIPPAALCAAVILFTIYHLGRYIWSHPDLSLYNLALWTSKPFVQLTRTANKHTLDQPSFRYVQRTPEFYMPDPIRELYKLGIAANDPFVARVKAAGREDELYMTNKEYTRAKPNLMDLIAHEEPAPARYGLVN